MYAKLLKINNIWKGAIEKITRTKFEISLTIWRIPDINNNIWILGFEV